MGGADPGPIDGGRNGVSDDGLCPASGSHDDRGGGSASDSHDGTDDECSILASEGPDGKGYNGVDFNGGQIPASGGRGGAGDSSTGSASNDRDDVACGGPSVWLHFSDRFICKGVDIIIYVLPTGDRFNISLFGLLYLYRTLSHYCSSVLVLFIGLLSMSGVHSYVRWYDHGYPGRR